MDKDTSATIKQMLRYGIVGGIAFVVDYGTLWLLTEKAELFYLMSAAVSFVLGLIVNYILSTLWVFDRNRFSNKLLEFTTFAIIGVIGLGLNELILYLSSNTLGLHYMIGKIISTVIVFFWNFFARKYIVFSTDSQADCSD